MVCENSRKIRAQEVKLKKLSEKNESVVQKLKKNGAELKVFKSVNERLIEVNSSLKEQLMNEKDKKF